MIIKLSKKTIYTFVSTIVIMLVSYILVLLLIPSKSLLPFANTVAVLIWIVPMLLVGLLAFILRNTQPDMSIGISAAGGIILFVSIIYAILVGTGILSIGPQSEVFTIVVP